MVRCVGRHWMVIGRHWMRPGPMTDGLSARIVTDARSSPWYNFGHLSDPQLHRRSLSWQRLSITATSFGDPPTFQIQLQLLMRTSRQHWSPMKWQPFPSVTENPLILSECHLKFLLDPSSTEYRPSYDVLLLFLPPLLFFFFPINPINEFKCFCPHFYPHIKGMQNISLNILLLALDLNSFI